MSYEMRLALICAGELVTLFAIITMVVCGLFFA